MTTFADSLKREIARVARKELKGEIAALRASLALQRSEISGLKKQLANFQADIKRLARAKQDSPRQARQIEPRSMPEETKSRPGRKVVFTAERLKAQRSRLGLTQEQMGKLLGVSSLSIWKWETGSSEPRASRVPEILSSLSLGKREALARIASNSE